MSLTEKAKRLIFDEEGLNQPGNWPGGSSGVTIGIGYDLGYKTGEKFREDWGQYLEEVDLNRLEKAVGVIGEEAKAIAPRYKDIVISRVDAEGVFMESSLPEFEQRTQEAFPGVENLPEDAYGALVSLVYNRGESMGTPGKSSWESRREMRAVRDLVPKGDLQAIADQIRGMKRLWIGKGVPGLLRRRDAEANLIESCI